MAWPRVRSAGGSPLSPEPGPPAGSDAGKKAHARAAEGLGPSIPNALRHSVRTPQRNRPGAMAVQPTGVRPSVLDAGPPIALCARDLSHRPQIPRRSGARPRIAGTRARNRRAGFRGEDHAWPCFLDDERVRGHRRAMHEGLRRLGGILRDGQRRVLDGKDADLQGDAISPGATGPAARSARRGCR